MSFTKVFAVFFGALVLSLPLSPSASAGDQSDPILGRWRWFTNRPKVFHADGTVSPHGTWKCVSPNQDPRKYVIDWGNGVWIDTLHLKKDASQLDGENQFGHHVTAYRLGP